ncbi:MAG TPA: ribokinase [Anaerolineae bacterium]|nr:ribokinase [Anaerolineae bacterium]
MPAQICVVGSSNIDLIARVPRLPKLGETTTGHSFHLGYGGKGANQAVMAAKLGARVTMVTKLGHDVFGDDTLKNYRNQGVDTTFVMFDESAASGVAPIFVDDQAQNFIVIVPGANNRLSPADAQAASTVIRSADVLVCQLEVPIDTTLEAFRIARSANVRTILNPAPAVPLPDELLQLTDICVPNETETELLTGLSVQSLSDAENAARKLLSRGVHTVILTLGERGALVIERNKVEQLAPVKVSPVDPTGAGDAFIGCLAVFLGEGLALRDAVRRANAIAALSVTKIGTQISFPDRVTADLFGAEHGIA